MSLHARDLTRVLGGELMRIFANLVIAGAALISVTHATYSAECFTFEKTGKFPNYAFVDTENGQLGLFYPSVDGPLDVKAIRLPNGSRFIGAVPDLVPFSFFFKNRVDQVVVLKSATITFATTRRSDERYVEYYDMLGTLVDTQRVAGVPVLERITETHKFDQSLNVIKADMYMPAAYISQICVDPGATTTTTPYDVMSVFN